MHLKYLKLKYYKPNMNIKTTHTKFIQDTRAVSPIMATLVLIVITLVSASAIGMMAGHFGDEVREYEMEGHVAAQTIQIGGCNVVKSVVNLIAKEFMEANAGVNIIVQGGEFNLYGGSGPGIAAVTYDIVDIGMASRPITRGELGKEPRLVNTTIGRMEVVVIAHNTTDLSLDKTDLKNAFRYGGSFSTNLTNANITTIVRMTDGGHAEHIFKRALGINNLNITYTERGSNNAIRTYITNNPGTIGFVTYGYRLSDYRTFRHDEISDLTQCAPLSAPLDMITVGNPNIFERAFLNFARQTGQRDIFGRVNALPLR